MSATDELLANAGRYAEAFDKGGLPMPPAKRMRCMPTPDHQGVEWDLTREVVPPRLGALMASLAISPYTLEVIEQFFTLGVLTKPDVFITAELTTLFDDGGDL